MKEQVLSAICLAVPFFAGAQNSEEPTILKDSKGIIQGLDFIVGFHFCRCHI
ncbi:hypothetical protein [Dyadobacter chenhuakuii]|jgi:hypothetical protein|uniref:Uncharacterized protein n=1 Tax=Dyadobacter chenhuakuii TaxID=2909339 RepID=A0A9X1Q869_9BACT|nr:hypothetical protein [Dyadobacter chenhuakuii]MCF2496670.1 hypothetical protein [Dyadobacter chenhuakuii]